MKSDKLVKTWVEEASRTVAASGLPWRVTAAWVEQKGLLLCADLRDTRTGKECRLTLQHDQFPTPAHRRAEVTRRLTTSTIDDRMKRE